MEDREPLWMHKYGEIRNDSNYDGRCTLLRFRKPELTKCDEAWFLFDGVYFRMAVGILLMKFSNDISVDRCKVMLRYWISCSIVSSSCDFGKELSDF